MKYFTSGKVFHTQARIALQYIDTEQFTMEADEQRLCRVVYVREGNGIFSINSKRLIVLAPAIFCLNPQDVCLREDRNQLLASSLYFYPGIISPECKKVDFASPDWQRESSTEGLYMLNSFMVRDGIFSPVMKLGLRVVEKVEFLFASIRHELQEQPSQTFWTCSSRSYLFECLFLLERLRHEHSTMDELILDSPTEHIDRILSYLHTEYKKKIQIEDLATTFAMNRTSLNKLFQDNFAMSPIAYLIKLRLEIACSLLKNTHLPISEIIDRVGFSDLSHFGRTFKKLTGHSPAEFRTRFCWLKA